MRPLIQTLALVLVTPLLLISCGEEAVESGPEAPLSITVLEAKHITKLREKAAVDGKVLVIDCWATWCSSCVAMFPKLHEATKERGDAVLLVTLSFDEGEESKLKAGKFLAKQNAMEGAFLAAEGSDAKDAIAKALSETWGGGVLPAVFVYNPDGTTAYELLETRGEPEDWVARIMGAVDEALKRADE